MYKTLALAVVLLVVPGCVHGHDPYERRRYDPYLDNTKTLRLLEQDRRRRELRDMRQPYQQPQVPVCGQYLQPYTRNGHPVYSWECR